MSRTTRGPFVLSPGSIFGQDAQAITLLEEAGARYRGINSFCATFEQVLTVPLLNETTTSSGSLCQAKPNLFAMRLEISSPEMKSLQNEYLQVKYDS